MKVQHDALGSDTKQRTLEGVLSDPKVTSTLHLKCQSSSVQAVHLEQVCEEGTHHQAGADHHITVELGCTTDVIWRKFGRRDFVGPAPNESITVIPAHEASFWRYSRSNKLHVFVPDDLLRNRIDQLGMDAAKATLPDVFARLDPTFSHLLKAVYHELHKHGGDTLLQETLHEAVCSMLISHYVDGLPKDVVNRSLALEHAVIRDTRITRAIDYAEANIGEALTVAELAGVACLSAGHFSRAFKATTGEAVWAYVQRRRGERAMEMLRHTNLPIAEIAYRCGFAHQGHLTDCFKRQFGATPGVVRRGSH